MIQIGLFIVLAVVQGSFSDDSNKTEVNQQFYNGCIQCKQITKITFFLKHDTIKNVGCTRKRFLFLKDKLYYDFESSSIFNLKNMCFRSIFHHHTSKTVLNNNKLSHRFLNELHRSKSSDIPVTRVELSQSYHPHVHVKKYKQPSTWFGSLKRLITPTPTPQESAQCIECERSRKHSYNFENVFPKTQLQKFLYLLHGNSVSRNLKSSFCVNKQHLSHSLHRNENLVQNHTQQTSVNVVKIYTPSVLSDYIDILSTKSQRYNDWYDWFLLLMKLKTPLSKYSSAVLEYKKVHKDSLILTNITYRAALNKTVLSNERKFYLYSDWYMNFVRSLRFICNVNKPVIHVFPYEEIIETVKLNDSNDLQLDAFVPETKPSENDIDINVPEVMVDKELQPDALVLETLPSENDIDINVPEVMVDKELQPETLVPETIPSEKDIDINVPEVIVDKELGPDVFVPETIPPENDIDINVPEMMVDKELRPDVFVPETIPPESDINVIVPEVKVDKELQPDALGPETIPSENDIDINVPEVIVDKELRPDALIQETIPPENDIITPEVMVDVEEDEIHSDRVNLNISSDYDMSDRNYSLWYYQKLSHYMKFNSINPNKVAIIKPIPTPPPLPPIQTVTKEENIRKLQAGEVSDSMLWILLLLTSMLVLFKRIFNTTSAPVKPATKEPAVVIEPNLEPLVGNVVMSPPADSFNATPLRQHNKPRMLSPPAAVLAARKMIEFELVVGIAEITKYPSTKI